MDRNLARAIDDRQADLPVMPGDLSSAATPTCSYWISWAQKPPKHRSEQHCPFAVHAEPTDSQAEPRLAHEPFVHTLVQQSALTVHAPATATQAAGWHVCVVVLHVPWQQSASVAHVPPWARHASLPNTHRDVSLSQTIEQQPCCGPELHVSPIPRQVVLAMSSWHWPAMQMFEQHCELAVHGSLSTPHSMPPHTPPLQSRLQQSVALVHATPSATQSGKHCVTQAMP
jgi:hypothetical protein